MRQERADLTYGMHANTWYTGTVRKDEGNGGLIEVRAINLSLLGSFKSTKDQTELPGFLFQISKKDRNTSLYSFFEANLGKSVKIFFTESKSAPVIDMIHI